MVQRCGQTELQTSIYGSSRLGVFSVTFMKCRHVTESWESGHRKRCVILSYNRYRGAREQFVYLFGLPHGFFIKVVFMKIFQLLISYELGV